jgi:hypothetical protein
MKISGQYLYELLPAYYRLIDETDQESTLKALAEILAGEAGKVEKNIGDLYENWFIETCEEWVVPYIGDLLGVRSIHEVEGAAFSRRAYVANTLAYRRRKGTLPVLEQLAFDVTGWRAKAVEFFQLLAATQNVNHIRLHSLATPNMRHMDALDRLDTAFDTHGHTVEVGRIAAGLGKYNIPNIGIYLWRLQSYPMKGVDALKITVPGEGFTFSPLGLDTHLFNQPVDEQEITHLAEEINVPGLLRRRALHDELTAIRDGETPPYTFLSGQNPAFTLRVQGETADIPLDKIVICNLKDWKPAPPTMRAAVDPVLGRVTFPTGVVVAGLTVSYNYGFSGDLGGGPYDRRASLVDLRAEDIDWQVGVSKDHLAVAGETIHTSLSDAIQAWKLQGASVKTGLITIMDNQTYDENLTGAFGIPVGEGQKLYIIAADWPVTYNGINPERKKGMFNPEDLRPHLRGDWEIEGTAPAGADDGGRICLNGLLLEGKVTVVAGNLDHCQLQHCTLVPDAGGLEILQQDEGAELLFERCICGSVMVDTPGAFVSITDAIIDHRTGMAINVPEGRLALRNTTVWGHVEARVLDAENCIFNDKVKIERRQTGCVRFSFVPAGSQTPRRYRCQPDLEIATLIQEKKDNNTDDLLITQEVLNRMIPVYNATQYGHHAYAQLRSSTPVQIRTGADNAAEMGAFNFLQQPQREANINIVLEEYLRLGLEAGIIFVT